MSYAAAIAAETAETHARRDAEIDALRAQVHGDAYDALSRARRARAQSLLAERRANRALLASFGLDRFGRPLSA